MSLTRYSGKGQPEGLKVDWNLLGAGGGGVRDGGRRGDYRGHREFWGA